MPTTSSEIITIRSIEGPQEAQAVAELTLKEFWDIPKINPEM